MKFVANHFDDEAADHLVELKEKAETAAAHLASDLMVDSDDDSNAILNVDDIHDIAAYHSAATHPKSSSPSRGALSQLSHAHKLRKRPAKSNNFFLLDWRFE